MNVPLAIALQVVGSFLFAGGAAIQHLGVARVVGSQEKPSGHGLSLAGMLRLLLTPKWLLGLTVISGGAALNLYALTMAPLAVAQPIGVLAVPWSVLLGARLHKTRITRRMWGAVSLTIVGVVAFTVVSSSFASDGNVFDFQTILIAFGVVSLVGLLLALLATRSRSWARPVLWGSVGAVFYGMASGMMKSAINLVRDHGRDPIHPQVLVVVACLLVSYGLGVWMIQRGYASGPAEITVGTMTTVDPVVAVTFGFVVLGEASRIGLGAALAMAASGAVAILGVVLLSKDHPEATDRRATTNPESTGSLSVA